VRVYRQEAARVGRFLEALALGSPRDLDPLETNVRSR
jgi:hypothetical protein